MLTSWRWFLWSHPLVDDALDFVLTYWRPLAVLVLSVVGFVIVWDFAVWAL